MSTGYHYNRPHKLHSPLLDGIKHSAKNSKELYLDKINDQTLEDTLDKTLFNEKEGNLKKLVNKINLDSISALENILKVSGFSIAIVGGLFCLLQLISVIEIYRSGSFDFSRDLMVFSISFIFTVTANAICIGFTHLIKATKYVYQNLDYQNNQLDEILNRLSKN